MLQVGLDQLDINALIKVLTEPKNAMVAQYHALFEMVCWVYSLRLALGSDTHPSVNSC
jgi:ATP-dependent protease Clp ATPase subunit